MGPTCGEYSQSTPRNSGAGTLCLLSCPAPSALRLFWYFRSGVRVAGFRVLQVLICLPCFFRPSLCSGFFSSLYALPKCLFASIMDVMGPIPLSSRLVADPEVRYLHAQASGDVSHNPPGLLLPRHDTANCAPSNIEVPGNLSLAQTRLYHQSLAPLFLRLPVKHVRHMTNKPHM